jgi:hypothetical protein
MPTSDSMMLASLANIMFACSIAYGVRRPLPLLTALSSKPSNDPHEPLRQQAIYTVTTGDIALCCVPTVNDSVARASEPQYLMVMRASLDLATNRTFEVTPGKLADFRKLLLKA